MAIVIVNAGLATGGVLGAIMARPREYLAAFDADAHGGRGEVRWTPDKAQAMRFADLPEALATWKRQSTVCPLRDDFRPNRPLTAYSVTFEGVEP